MRAAFHHALVTLRHASSVVVCAHVRPDGDAVGSVLAMTLALRENGIAAVPTLANVEDPPTTYSFLPGFGLYVPAEQLEAPDVFIAMDCPSAVRLGLGQPLMESAQSVIVFDHHPDGDEYGTLNIIDVTASATAQLVWEFAKTARHAERRCRGVLLRGPRDRHRPLLLRQHHSAVACGTPPTWSTPA